MATQNNIGQHTNAVDAVRAAGVEVSDEGRRLYSGAGGVGKSPFDYTKGSGADAVCFTFALNGAYNANAMMTRAAVTLDMLAYVEMGLWPGKTRGAAEPQIASMFGRGFVENVNGQYRLTQGGLTRARLMLAALGIVWPDDGGEKPPKAAKAKKPRKAKATKVTPAEGSAEALLAPGEAMSEQADGTFALTSVEVAPDESGQRGETGQI